MFHENCRLKSTCFLCVAVLQLSFPICASLPAQRGETDSRSSPGGVAILGRVLAAPDPMLHNGGNLSCRFEQFLFGAELEGAARQRVLMPVLVSFCYYGYEAPLPETFFDHTILYELHVTRDPVADVLLKDVAFHRQVDPSTGKSEPPTMGMRVLGGVPRNLLKPDLLLPCYVLYSDGYKVVRQDTRRVSTPKTQAAKP